MLRDSETSLIPESAALHEAYKKAFQKGLLACGIGRGAIRAMESKSRIPALEMNCEFSGQALKLPCNIQELLQQVYPHAPTFVSRIQLTETDIAMVQTLSKHSTNDSGKLLIPPTDENPQIEVSRLVMIMNGECNYHKFAKGQFKTSGGVIADSVAVERIPLTTAEMADIVKLPQLVANDKMGFAASRYVEKIWFTRDLFTMAAMGQCPFREKPRSR